MAAYHKVEVSLNTNAAEVGIPSPQTVNVVVPTIGPAGPAGSVGPTGPQGPQGIPGTGIEVLTTQGDLLYRGASTGQRLPIGTAGQILKVSSGGIPEWGAPPASGVSSVNGQTGAVTITAASIDAAEDFHTHNFSDIQVNGVFISGAGDASANGPYLYSGDFGDRGAYHKDKDSLIYWDGSAWMISVNGDDRYTSTQDVSFPYQVTSWSVLPGSGTAPAPTVSTRLNGQEFEEVVGQRINPTLRGDAAGKNVGTGANDVAAGNHRHGNLSNDGKVGTTSGLPLKTGTNGVVEAGSFGTSAGTFCEGNDARLSDARTPSSTLAHAASHQVDREARYAGKASGMATKVIIVADNVGAAGNSISLSFNGTDTIETVLAAWNAANTSNTASLVAGDETQIPSNGQTITLSGGVNAGTDTLSPFNQSLNTTDSVAFSGFTVGDGEVIAVGDNYGQFTSINSNTGFIINRGQNNNFASLDFLEGGSGASGWSIQLQPNIDNLAFANRVQSFNQLTLPATGDVGLSVSGDISVYDRTNEVTATFVAQENLSDNRSYQLPDADGTLALTTDNADQFGSGAAADGYVLTADGAGGAAWEAATGGGGGDTVSIETTAADVLSVSSGAISADDAGADRIVYWNNTSNKLAYGTPSDVGAAASSHTHSDATQSVAGFMSTADKTKLDGIASGAEANVNADWNASSGDAQILNKPTLGTAAAAATTDFAAASHTHAASAITSGTLDVARLPVGTGSTNVLAPTIVDAKGDLIVASAADAVARLPVGGTNGHVLTVDSAETLGVKWAAAAGGGSGGTKTYAVFTAEHNQPPSTSFATLDTRNSIAVLDFDDASTESAVFVGIMPEAASLGSGLIVNLDFMATTATSGNVRWSVAFERCNTDLDSDSFDTATAATVATSGTSGIVAVGSITCTAIDGITAGDLFRLRVQRLGGDAADSASGDIELVAVEVRSAA
jgi:hypothetical protein